MADKLTIFNDALLHLKERAIVSLSEETRTRKQLEQAFNGGRVADVLLETYDWTFAMRFVRLDPSEQHESQFGLRYAFELPENDVARSVGVFDDPRFSCSVDIYQRSGDIIFTDCPVIYVRYVSKELGRDIGNWSETYASAVAAAIAMRCSGSLGELDGNEKAELNAYYKKAIRNAKMHNNVGAPIRQYNMSKYSRSRIGYGWHGNYGGYGRYGSNT